MINLFERTSLFLKIAIMVFAILLVFLVFMIVLGRRIPWFALDWWQAPSPQQIGMLRWDQQGLPLKVPVEGATRLSDVAFDGNYLWFTGVYTKNDEEKGTVFQVNPRTYKTLGKVDVNMDPRGVVFDGQHIWVANQVSKSLSCIDLTENSTASTGTTTPTATADAETAQLKASDWGLASDVITTKDITTVFAESPTYLAYDGEHIWVTDRDSNTVWRLPAGSCDRPESEYTDTRIEKVNGGDIKFKQPFGIIFDGTYIWVANQGSNDVVRLDPHKCTDKECTDVRIINVGSKPSNLAYDGTFVWVTLNGTNPGQVARIHARTGLEFGKPISLKPIRISDQPTTTPTPKPEPCSKTLENAELDGIAFDGKYIWVASNTGWVCQLLARDATPVDEFCVFDNEENDCANHNETNENKNTKETKYPASRIAFDGTFIWIIISDGDKSFLIRR